LWAPLTLAYTWVHQIATLLSHPEDFQLAELQPQFQQILEQMQQHKSQVGELAEGIDHFLKVTRSYQPGLFHCYIIQDFPRTNNDLEQVFGQFRHHQRRVTGRKAAPASLVLRGSVRLVAAIATRIQTFSPKDFAIIPRDEWQAVRLELRNHQLKRIEQRRFRRDPDRYLAELEAQFLQLTFPH
jgi:hypothetical protein